MSSKGGNVQTGVLRVEQAKSRTVTVSGRGWRRLRPILAAVVGASLLGGVYLAIVTWAQGWQHAVGLLWQDRLLAVPIVVGFGAQVGLYSYARLNLHSAGRGAGAMTGAGGGTSTAAMVACCAHHVSDLLPLVGLSAAATFLGNHKVPLMLVGLAMNLAGIGLALRVIWKERRQAVQGRLPSSLTMSEQE